ncbi:MAG: hypothetical protein WCG87_04105 [Bacteroidota bacterium]
MKLLLSICLLLLLCLSSQAQVNLVRNPSFEQHSQCPNAYDQIRFANYWSPIDTDNSHPICSPEYCNICGAGVAGSVPNNGYFYQYPRTGDGMAQVQMFYDESISPPLIIYIGTIYKGGCICH